jgi:acetolactate synthase-1/2/3 large subunit
MTNDAPLSGGEAIVRSLVENDVDTVFGLPGAQMYPLFDALYQERARIRTIGARHEQGTAYMAFGYARSTGKVGVFSVVPGPGVLNTAAALSTALGCSTPLLCITGQVPSEFLGRGRGHLHELPDQLATLRSITKWAARIERPADVPRVMNEAFRQALSGRPGPVSIEMAWDVMGRREQVAAAGKAVLDRAPAPDPQAIERAAQLLRTAQHPLIMTGSGAQHAADAVVALAEALGAPVAAFRGGRGIMPEDHPLGISSYAASLLWPDTDVLIGIGTRLEMPYMRWTGMMQLIDRPVPPPHLIRLDIDPVEMVRLKPQVGIVADAGAAASALLAALGKRPAADATRIAAAKAAAAAAIRKVQPELAYLEVIRDVLPRDGILVEELCQVGFTSYFGYPVLAPYTYISTGFPGTLGYGFPTALGVKAAHPDRAVVSITGDGGFLFGVQELASAVQHGIGLVTLVFNNNAFGNVRRDQQERFQGRLIGADLVNPDFGLLAQAFGVGFERVASPAALQPALQKALAQSGPALIEILVPQDSEASPWEFIHPAVAVRPSTAR